MEERVKLYPTDSLINEFYCNIATSCYLIAKKEKRQNNAWYRIRLRSFTKYMMIMIRAIEVIEDDYEKGVFRHRKFMKYEVQPNPWGIEFLEYRRNEGFFVIGKRIELFRIPPISYTVKI